MIQFFQNVGQTIPCTPYAFQITYMSNWVLTSLFKKTKMSDNQESVPMPGYWLGNYGRWARVIYTTA